MSAAHDAHADASAGHHDAHDHFDNEPATELGADEPRTPNWVPYLGLALFFSAGVACMLCSDEDKPAADKPVAAAVAVEAAPAAQPMPREMPMPGVRPGTPVPLQPGQPAGANGINALKQLDPNQAKELQKLIDQQRAQQPGANGAAPPVPQPGAAPQRAPQPAPPGANPRHL